MCYYLYLFMMIINVINMFDCSRKKNQLSTNLDLIIVNVKLFKLNRSSSIRYLQQRYANLLHTHTRHLIRYDD